MPRPKKPEKLKKKKISITLSPELIEELKREAHYKGLSLSELIEQQLKNPTPWDIQQFGRFIQAINAYNGAKLDYSLDYKTIAVEFRLKNSKGRSNLHKAVLEFSWCIDCPGPYMVVKLFGWDEKKNEWFEMGEESFFDINGEEIFNAILKIRRDFWLKLKTFREEKKKKKPKGG